MKVGIDTSSLSEVLNDDDLATRFVDRLQGSSTLHVPGELVDEMCCGPDVRSAQRLDRFRDLWARLPSLEVLPTFLEVWRWEYRGRPRKRFPYITRLVRENLTIVDSPALGAIRSQVQSVKEFYEDMHLRADSAKEWMKGEDDKQEKARVAQWYGNLCRLSCDKIPPWLVKAGLERVGLGTRVRRSMLAHPRCFRAGWTWHLLFYAGMIANAIDPKWRARQEFSLLKPFGLDRNNVYDDYLAAASAYCDIFVSDDGGFRERLLHLRRRKLAKMKPMKLEDFLLSS